MISDDINEMVSTKHIPRGPGIILNARQVPLSAVNSIFEGQHKQTVKPAIQVSDGDNDLAPIRAMTGASIVDGG
jgi:hypothetical protein